MAIVAIVYHSGFGHTKLQAEAVHRGAGSVAGVEARLYTSEEGIAKLDELDQADAIIFGCPTYMGNISADIVFWGQAEHFDRASHQRHATRHDLRRHRSLAGGQPP